MADRDEPIHVLFVEDSPVLRELVGAVLGEDMRYALTLAGHAQEALQYARTRRFDLIVLDINLQPGASGEDLLVLFRAMPAHADVPIVAVTAYAVPGDRERLLASGFTAYLEKPFSVSRLLAFLDDVVNEGRATGDEGRATGEEESGEGTTAG